MKINEAESTKNVILCTLLSAILAIVIVASMFGLVNSMEFWQNKVFVFGGAIIFIALVYFFVHGANELYKRFKEAQTIFRTKSKKQ
jgi:predicted membrane chloride channel (bestrophin family)